ncbi:MAG: hypothetical protein ACXACB_06905, partial [Promethearchaeota archaeon]
RGLILDIFNKSFVEKFREGARKLYPKNLIWKNFLMGKKSHNIRFPRNSPRVVLMAGLLGFFDGDGTHSGDTARIGNIMNKAFLDDIIEVFNLRNTETKEHIENGKIRGYYLTLGAKFFNELISNYDRSLPRKRREYERFVNKFPLKREQLQELVYQNPGANGYELAKIIHTKTGVNVGARTVYEKLADPKWGIEKLSLDEYYKRLIINLRKRGWSLKEIWSNTEEGLGFSKQSWNKNTGRFFKRIFRNEKFIKVKSGSLVKIIEDNYKPSN